MSDDDEDEEGSEGEEEMSDGEAERAKRLANQGTKSSAAAALQVILHVLCMKIFAAILGSGCTQP